MGSPPNLSAILDCSTSFDANKVSLLDAAVAAMLGSQQQNRENAHLILTQFKQLPDAWRVVGTILETSDKIDTKFFALTILQQAIKTKWNMFPESDRIAIPQYMMSLSLACAKNPAMANQKYFTTKVNEIVTDIARREWPDRWPSFIADLCEASKSNQSVCESNMQIMTLLSEEIFDFGKDEMTSRRCIKLRETLAVEFQRIVDVCLMVLVLYKDNPSSVGTSLVTATLNCLSHYLRWIPTDFIFESQIPDLLIDVFWDPLNFRISCLKCFIEIFGLTDLSPQGYEKLTLTWIKLCGKIQALPQQTMDYEKIPSNARAYWDICFAQMSICMTVLLKNHMENVIEGKHPSAASVYNSQNFDPKAGAVAALTFVQQLTSLPNDETFKICVEFWHFYCDKLLQVILEKARLTSDVSQSASTVEDTQDEADMMAGLSRVSPIDNPTVYSRRLARHQPILNNVRRTLIGRMAKPQEVYVTYDEETGEVERDYNPDTDEIALYNLIREALIYLTNLGGDEMEMIMTNMLHSISDSVQRDGTQKTWNPMSLNRLCWAVGSISGAMNRKKEIAFAVHLIKTLLWFCEVKRGKENKALVASMIMYVMGQYPRLLNDNIKFREVVIHKLFEFMVDPFPGVQQMACETFSRICKRCRKKIASHVCTLPDGSKVSFLHSMFNQLPSLTAALNSTINNTLLLFHAFGVLISGAPAGDQPGLIEALLMRENQEWSQQLLPLRHQDTNSFLQSPILRRVTEILRINERVADATGAGFAKQLQFMLSDSLDLYNVADQAMLMAVRQGGINTMGHVEVKHLRNVKRATLGLIDSFVTSTGASGGADVRSQIVTVVLGPVGQTAFRGYRECTIPEARDHEVLGLAGSLVNHLKGECLPEIPNMFENLFSPSLEMITKDFNAYPDIRLKFYEWLKVVIEHCFSGIIGLPEQTNRLVVEGLVWGCKHEQPKIAELGLRVLIMYLKALTSNSASSPALLNSFASTFYYCFIDEILGIMTDTLHSSGFALQCLVLQELIRWVDSGVVNIPASNLTRELIMSSLAAKFCSAFPNLNQKQIEILVVNMFVKANAEPTEFQSVLRDFLVQIKEFGGAEELFEAERQEALKAASEMERQRKQAMVAGLQPQFHSVDVAAIDNFD